VLVEYRPYPCVALCVRTDDAGRLVGRCIVNRKQLEVMVRLTKDRVERLRQSSFAVMNGKDDRDAHVYIAPASSHRAWTPASNEICGVHPSSRRALLMSSTTHDGRRSVSADGGS